MNTFKIKTSFLTKLSFGSTLSCMAMNSSDENNDIKKYNIINNNINEQETEYEKYFRKVLGKKYNRENGELILFRTNNCISCINNEENLIIEKDNIPYFFSIDKNLKTPYLDIFDNTDIQYIDLFTATKPFPSLRECNKLTKIQLSIDNDEDTKYLDDLLNTIKNVKNLQELDLKYLYYYFFSGYNNDILLVVDKIITSLKYVFPKLKYIYPDIYINPRSKKYIFEDFKNKKEIFDIITDNYKNVFNNYKSEIKNNIVNLENYINIISKYFNDLDNDLKEKEKDLYDIKLLENKIGNYKNKLINLKKNNLSDNNIIIIKENIKTLSDILSVENQNNAKIYLKNKISELKKEKNIIFKYKFNFLKSKLNLLINNSLINYNIKNIEKKNYKKIKNIYNFIFKIKQKIDICPDWKFINYLGNECVICLENIKINDIEKGLTKTSCNHIFHKKCLNTWRIQKNTCPTCRRLINNN